MAEEFMILYFIDKIHLMS